MKILEMIRFLVFPPKCIGCGDILHYDRASCAFCEVCEVKWEQEKARIAARAGGVAVREITPADSGADREVYAMYLVGYKPGSRGDIVARIIMKLKDTAQSNAVDFAAEEFANLIFEGAPLVYSGGSAHENAVITWIPRSRSAMRDVGFDHMELVAKALSKRLGIPARRLMKRTSFAAEQKRLGAKQRKDNAKRRMKLINGISLDSATVILIDDIVTTGASVAAASELLMGAGAGQVIVAVLASTERDEYRPNHTRKHFNIIKMRKSKEP